MCEVIGDNKRDVNASLEYIRVRLYLMASMPDFEEMVKDKVHLYLEHSFQKEIAKRLNVSKKKRQHASNLERIARARLKAIENEEEADAYNEIANSIAETIEDDVVILPENLRKFQIVVLAYS